MKKYLVFDFSASSGVSAIFAEKEFLSISSQTFKMLFDYTVADDGKITLIYSDKAKKFCKEYNSLIEVGGAVKPDLFISREKEKYIIYRFLVEYHAETREVLTIFDTYFALNKEEKFFQIDITNLRLNDAYKNEKLDYTKLDEKIFYDSIVYGIVRKICANAESRDKIDELLKSCEKMQSLYKINERNAKAVPQALNFIFFRNLMGAEMAVRFIDFPQTEQFEHAIQILNQKPN